MILTSTQKQIKLLKEFYSQTSIKKTVQEYQNFMKITINNKENNKHYILNFTQINFDYPLNTLIDEFLNYLLALEHQHKSTSIHTSK